jgi:mRNA interferase RelE/StbE
MKYRIVVRSKAQKQLRKIPETFRLRIFRAIDSLRENPLIGKKLEGEFEGCHCISIKPYRVIYIIEKKTITVTILKIGHRQGMYK